MMRKIETDEERYEAAGFVLDCILADGMVDDPLGDAASLRPTDVVRAPNGSLLFVLCVVRPCDSDGIGLVANIEGGDRVLIGVS
jgi:hypothetical protein